MCIPVWDDDCTVGDALGDAAGDLVGGWMDDLAAEFGETATNILEVAMTGWLSVSPETPEGPIEFLQDRTSWYVAAIAVFSLMIAAGKMVLERNAKAAKDATRGMIVLVLVSFAGVPTLLALKEFSDGYPPWIVKQATSNALSERLAEVFGDLVRFTGSTGAIAVMAIAFLLIVASLIQMLLVIAMSALMVLLVGLLPLAAAASISSGGRSILAKYMSWLAAALLYKPVAATIYAAGFKMLDAADNPDKDSLWMVLQGLMMMALAIVALPAIIRLVAPLSASVGGGGGGVAAAGVAAVGAVASGAIQLGSSKGAGGSSGGSAPTGGGGVAPAGAQQPGLPSGGGAKPPGGGVAPSAGGGGAAMAGTGGAGAATGGGAAMAGAGAAGAATGGVATAAMVVGKAGAQVGQAGMQAAQSTATAATGADER